MFLKKINLAKVKSIHFIGIGGVGMSAAAILAKAKGFAVSGSDSQEIYPPTSEILQRAKIKYQVGYQAKNYLNDRSRKLIKPDLVVIGGGENDKSNSEVKLAVKKKWPLVSFPQLIGAMTEQNSNIVITGAHGKTSTAAVIGCLLHELKFKPSIWVGGEMKNFSTNAVLDSGQYFVMEGDEYKTAYWDKNPKFHYYHPQILIIHNLEVDHFDIYENLTALIKCFQEEVKRIPRTGLIIANGDDQNIRAICAQANCRVIFYGFNKINNYHPRQIKVSGQKNSFALYAGSKKLANFLVPQIGLHNIYNALPAIILAKEFGADYSKINSALQKFKGITRRLDVKGSIKGITIIDDYAHNPAKVKAALSAVRLQYPLRRIWAVFEPHTYTRTLFTLSALAQNFGNASRVIISEIYAAREKGMQKLISAEQVAEEIAKYHPEVQLIKTKPEVLQYLIKNLKRGDVVVVMAVGAFNKLAEELLKKLQQKR